MFSKSAFGNEVVRRIGGCAIVACGLIAAACAGPAGDVAGPAVVEQAPEARGFSKVLDQKKALQCEAGKEHWRSEGSPKRGGTFTYSVASAGQHLDLSIAGSRNVTPQVYRYLVKPRACYYEDNTMEPDLAQSWQLSPDGLAWTLKLRNDVRWHNKPPVNGRPLTSGDVAWTIDYQKDGGGLRSYWVDVNHQEPDPQTVVLRMPEPDADFLGKLGYDVNVILPREVKEQAGDFKTVAIGTGPYMLREFKQNESITMERNPDWKDAGHDGKPLPYIDEIRGILFPDYVSELAAFRAGQLDLNRVGGFAKRDADAVKEANPKLTSYTDVVLGNWGLWFNLSRRPFDDPRVRRALGLAINRDDIIGSNQGGAIYTGFMPSGIVEYAWPVERATAKFKQDLETTRRLLAEAGYGSGGPRLVYRTSPGNQVDAEVAQQHLQSAGIETEMAVEPSNVPIGVVLARGDYDLAYGGPTTSGLADYWVGGVVRTGGAQNYQKFSDPRVDALSRAQAREVDPTKRRAIIDQLQDQLFELMPYSPTINKIYFRFYTCRTKSMKPAHQSLNLEGIAQAWLDGAGC